MSVPCYNSASEFEYGELNFSRHREVRPRCASYRDAINRDREPRRQKVKLLALDYTPSIIICALWSVKKIEFHYMHPLVHITIKKLAKSGEPKFFKSRIEYQYYFWKEYLLYMYNLLI